MSFAKKLEILLKAKTPCIWIETYEEQRIIADISAIIRNKFAGTNLYSWSLFEGLKKEKLTRFEEDTPSKPSSPDAVYRAIIETQKSKDKRKDVYILKDFHSFKTNPLIIRGLRDVVERNKVEIKNYTPIIVISPIVNINNDVDKIFTVIKYETPNEDMIRKIVNKFKEKVEDNDGLVEKTEIEKCIRLAKGLTMNEIINYLSRSVAENKTISSKIFLEARKELIKKTGVLEYKETSLSLEDMGGNQNFKEWISDVALTFEDDAEDYGVEKSKGYLTIGPPGTAKTLSAEMIASCFELPLLKLEMQSIMGSLVGQSERNMAKAIDVIKACSPCVLFIDEIEKSLSGAGSGAGSGGSVSDGGAMKRVFGILLEYLSSPESSDTFTIMTSNDASAMPPELTRSGRLDTIWFFDLPSEEEREAIFKIHFNKRNQEVDDKLIKYCVDNTKNFSGAEIQEAVKVAVRNSFKRYKQTGKKEITKEDINIATNNAVIVYNYSREKILTLREYSKNRARIANSCSENKNKDSKGAINIISLK